MIGASKRFYEYFLKLYEANNANIFSRKDFEEIFENNASRMEYIISLFEGYKHNALTSSGKQVFNETIDYIVSFINGDKKDKEIRIPKKYFNDKDIGAIIPTMDELNLLLKLIESNKVMFETFYKDNEIFIKLPDESFNQNMSRLLEIKEHNLAHLLGLTEHEDYLNPDPSKNLLKKYILNVVNDSKKYGSTEAEIILNWITSLEGQFKLQKVHSEILKFVEHDKKIYPSSYDDEGNLKTNSSTVIKFKERCKNATGLDYPIIDFSRCMVKAINTLNFLNLNNVVEMILDYNPPIGKKNQKDIFLVVGKTKRIISKNNQFINMRNDLLLDLYKYAFNQENIYLKNKLISNGIDVNDKEIKNQLNIILTDKYLARYGIYLDDSSIDEEIIEALNEYFDREVHLLGFNTEFNGDKEIPMNEHKIHHAHCDTSISLTLPELIGHYYKRGRTFFLDKLETTGERQIMKVSNVVEEMKYLRSVKYINENANMDLEHLKILRTSLNESYKNYLIDKQERNR